MDPVELRVPEPAKMMEWGHEKYPDFTRYG